MLSQLLYLCMSNQTQYSEENTIKYRSNFWNILNLCLKHDSIENNFSRYTLKLSSYKPQITDHMPAKILITIV